MDHHDSQIEALQALDHQFQETIDKLKSLPQKLSHEVKVPFGKMAFFEGKIVRTNETMILLGDDYYAKRTAANSAGLLERRQKLVKEQIQLIQEERVSATKGRERKTGEQSITLRPQGQGQEMEKKGKVTRDLDGNFVIEEEYTSSEESD